MTGDLNYGLALMQEQLYVSGQWLLVRLKLKQLSINEWHELRVRTKFVEQAVKRWKEK
jgi:hypothetical protein